MIPTPEAKRLLRMHLALECIQIVDRKRLTRIECADPDDIPRFYVAQFPDLDAERFYREDVPNNIVNQLNKVLEMGAFMEQRTVKGLLKPHGPVDHIHFGKSYIFPETLPAPDAQIQVVTHENRPTHALTLDGRVIAFCQSSREDDASAEAWVFTEPAHRQRGYARRVTAAWAADVRSRGKTPFYSHVIENKASQALANSLGLLPYIMDIGYF